MRSLLKMALSACIACACSGIASAALIVRGNGLIYDDVLNVTWLADANFSKTSGYDSDGRMNWSEAMAWADNLSVGGYLDWRLPTVSVGPEGCDYGYAGTTCGWNVKTLDQATGTVFSEFAYMYYANLGLRAPISTDGQVQANYGLFGNGTLNGLDNSSQGQIDIGPFINIQAYAYWIGTSYDDSGPGHAWRFHFDDGGQYPNRKYVEFYAWALRDGDVTAIPEPGAISLAAVAILWALWFSRPRLRPNA